MNEREHIMLGIIAIISGALLLVSVWYWNTGDDWTNRYREGFCAAQHAEYVEPNLCMDDGRVVSVWTK